MCCNGAETREEWASGGTYKLRSALPSHCNGTRMHGIVGNRLAICPNSHFPMSTSLAKPSATLAGRIAKFRRPSMGKSSDMAHVHMHAEPSHSRAHHSSIVHEHFEVAVRPFRLVSRRGKLASETAAVRAARDILFETQPLRLPLVRPFCFTKRMTEVPCSQRLAISLPLCAWVFV
ncbi:uncharacterized protein B0I36DRAFT_117192 [Microdochium trichocladiopsis]|uniref:Uncharacterized protein n=1 Tax=Microdochium trichocladiopsis TaxID=1682393 RepID=A0A9P9BQK5_9PEZI|nr:uncharacterized protein B0I36DRAFT_117192 [Microdochium trichocladiopsis]KAH7030978.1 hypothetical protein B0I36DRAFT_117192 [Microdochium trichocladiopsis]